MSVAPLSATAPINHPYFQTGSEGRGEDGALVRLHHGVRGGGRRLQRGQQARAHLHLITHLRSFDVLSTPFKGASCIVAQVEVESDNTVSLSSITCQFPGGPLT